MPASDDETKDIEMQETGAKVETETEKDPDKSEKKSKKGGMTKEEEKEAKAAKKKKKEEDNKKKADEEAEEKKEADEEGDEVGELDADTLERSKTVISKQNDDKGLQSLRNHYLDRKHLTDAQKSTCCVGLREKFHDKYDVYVKLKVYPFKIALTTKVLDDAGTDCVFTREQRNHAKIKCKWPDEHFKDIDYEPYVSIAVFDKEKTRDEKLGDCKITISTLFKHKNKKQQFEGILTRPGVELGDLIYSGDVFIKGMWDGTNLNIEVTECKNLVERADVAAAKAKGGGGIVGMASLAVFIFLATGMLFYCLAMPVHSPVYDGTGAIVYKDDGSLETVDDRFSGVEALFFCIYTLTTVGYGDSRIIGQAYGSLDVNGMPIEPNHAAMWFTSVYILVGIGGIAAALGIVGDHVMEKIQEAAATGLSNEEDEFADEDDSELTKVFTRPNKCKGCVVATPSSVWAFLGILVLMTGYYRSIDMRDADTAAMDLRKSTIGDSLFDPLYENNGDYWSWSIAFYFSVVTMTTVGYGDIGPANTTGWVGGLFFMMFGTLATAKAIGDILGLYFDAQTAKRRKMIMDTAFQTEADIQFFDEDGDGTVSEYEFLSKMLVKLKLLPQSQIDELHVQYTDMDEGGDGEVSIEEIRKMFKIDSNSKRTVDIKINTVGTTGVFAAATGQ